MKPTELIGGKFGKLFVIEKSENVSPSGKPLYKCHCDCGNDCEVTKTILLNSRLPCCGCERPDPLAPGFKNGHLTIVKSLGSGKWLCHCDACDGDDVIVTTHTIGRIYVNPHWPNCGCLSGPNTQQARNMWYGMKSRCYNKNNHKYARYGARGIQVYEPWKNSFEEFYLWLKNNIGLRPGPEYSLDRIDNNGNYEPGNIRWATTLEQIRNSTNPILNVDQVCEIKTAYLDWAGDTKIAFCKEMAKQYNCQPSCIKNILQNTVWKDVEPIITPE